MEHNLGWIAIGMILIAWSVHNLRWSFRLYKIQSNMEKTRKELEGQLDSAKKLAELARKHYNDSLDEIKKMRTWAEMIKTAARGAEIEVEKEHTP